jgi:hypothetical protein
MLTKNKAIKGIGIAVLIAIPIIIILNKALGKSNSNNLPKDLNLNGRKLVIGDSHSVGIGKATKGVEVDKRIAVGGWTLANLMSALNNYSITKDVTVIFISIGTNGQFSSADKIEDLIKLLHQKFPNASLFIYKGSYGWSGSRTKEQLVERMNSYYKRFADNGVIVLKNGLGYFADGGEAHGINTPQAKEIINEIEDIIKA